MESISVPQGTFRLSRYPSRHNEQLRAWDAADELILNWLEESKSLATKAKLLLVNDSFGALSVALSSQALGFEAEKNMQIQNDRNSTHLEIVSVVDSFLSRQGLIYNFAKNHLNMERVKLVSLLDLPSIEAGGKLDLVLIKIPKSLAQLEELLHQINPMIDDKTLVIAGGMVKSIHRSTLELFENIIGPTRTSLATKKARLIFADKDNSLRVAENPFPKEYRLEPEITGVQQEATLFSHGSVFSHAQLDIGTRFLLQSIPSDLAEAKILDLGCGNGVLGLVAAMRNPNARLAFADESDLAIQSAKQSVRATLGEERFAEMDFYVTNCADGIAEQSQDLILNNPPFHAQGGRTDQISLDMFKGAYSALKRGGELWVVGNRHLGYHKKLKQIFGNCRVLESNPKFVLLCAQK